MPDKQILKQKKTEQSSVFFMPIIMPPIVHYFLYH